MRHFKLPLIVTAITLPLFIVIGIAAMIYIASTSPAGQAQQRAEMLGQGLAILSMVIIGPFWILAAGKVGQERRAALAAKSAKPKGKRPR